MKSSKTTAAGVIGGLGMILLNVYYALDMDPETLFSMEGVITGLGMMGIGWFARDHDVSSQDAGIR
mgnify:CR=1 FL=1